MKALVISSLCTGLTAIESLLRNPEITCVHYYDSGDYFSRLDPRVKYLGRFNPKSFLSPNIYAIVIDTTSVKVSKTIDRHFRLAPIKAGCLFDQRWIFTEKDKYKFKQYVRNRGVRVPDDYIHGSKEEVESYLATLMLPKAVVKQYWSNHTKYPVIYEKGSKLPVTDTPLFVESYHEFSHYYHIAYMLKDGMYHIMSIQYLEKNTDRYVKGFSLSEERKLMPSEVKTSSHKILDPLARDFDGSPVKFGTLQFGYSGGNYYFLENQARLNCMGLMSIPRLDHFIHKPEAWDVMNSECLYSTRSYFLKKGAILDLSMFPRESFFIASYDPQICDRNSDGVFRSKSSRFLVMFRDRALREDIDSHIMRQSVVRD